jgi:hypothetical protein
VHLWCTAAYLQVLTKAENGYSTPKAMDLPITIFVWHLGKFKLKFFLLRAVLRHHMLSSLSSFKLRGLAGWLCLPERGLAGWLRPPERGLAGGLRPHLSNQLAGYAHLYGAFGSWRADC